MAESSYSPSESPPPQSSNTTEARLNRDSIKKGFNDLRKFADTNFTRAKQFVTEKAGKAEGVTEFDRDYEDLCTKMDQIKIVTEKMIAQVETLIQPNPNIRWEDWARTKLDRPIPARLNPHDTLGKTLTEASDSFGSETEYGSYLLQCAQVETKIGESRKRFEDAVMKDVLTPLKAFMELDLKSIVRERKVLGVNRLDLDARRASHKKAQGNKVAVTERALRDAQAEYDQQLEKVRSALKKVVDSHFNNKGYVRSLVAAQKTYYDECQSHFTNMGSVALTSSLNGTQEERKVLIGGLELDREESRKARMLYDYDAINPDEITVNAGEALTVTPIPGDDELVMAEYQGKSGKVPSTYIEYL